MMQNSEQQNVITYLDNILYKRNTKEDQQSILKYQLEIDKSDRQQRALQCIPYYNQRLLELGYIKSQIYPVLNKYQNSLPPFQEILNEVRIQPQIRCLNEKDFQGLQELTYNKNKIEPNELQKRILLNFSKLYEMKRQKALFVLATGLGKTYLSIFASQPILAEKDSVLVFVVNSIFIKTQAMNTYQQYFKQYKCCDITENQIIDSDAKIYFALFQSLHLIPQNIKQKINMIVLDEVHHILAPSYLQLVKEYLNKCKFVIGMTATLTHRIDPDGQKILELFNNNLVCNLPWTIAKNLNLFPQVQYIECHKQLDQQEIHEGNEYQFLLLYINENMKTLQQIQVEKQKLLNEQNKLQNIKIILQLYKNKFNKVIMFMNSVNDVIQCSQFLINNGYQNVYQAHYKVKKAILNQNMDLFKDNTQLSFLITVDMATEGYDLPNIDCVFNCRQTDSERLFVQQMGRALRKTKNKKQVFIFDLVCNLRNRWLQLYMTQEYNMNQIKSQMNSFWQVKTLQ